MVKPWLYLKQVIDNMYAMVLSEGIFFIITTNKQEIFKAIFSVFLHH